MTIVRHPSGRIHTGVLFQEASNYCTDECGTGTVCFEHMIQRLQEVADEDMKLAAERDRYKAALEEIVAIKDKTYLDEPVWIAQKALQITNDLGDWKK